MSTQPMLRQKKSNVLEYEIQSPNEKGLVQIKKTDLLDGRISFEAVSSNGETSKIIVKTVPVEGKTCSKIGKISEINIANGDFYESFALLSENNSVNDSEAAWKNKLKSEDDRIYSTPGLKILQSVVLNFTDLQNRVLKKSKQTTAPGANYLEEAPVDLPAAGGCTVKCYRVATIIPIFSCDGGLWNNCKCPVGDGVFIVYDCVVNIICDVNCSSFVS